MNKKYKYIDLSGYSFTGKGAYNNLFAEFKNYHTHPYDFEFDIIRTKDGILDLYIALVKDWSPVRSSEAVRRFQKLIESYAGNKTIIDRLITSGRHYDFMFQNFTKESNKYINSLINSSWEGLWPFAYEQKSVIYIMIMKMLYYLGYKDIFESTVYLSAPSEEEFLLKTRSYLNKILFSKLEQNISTIVTNNVFEPFNPFQSMQFFENSKSIIIDRDPRDIYLAALDYTNKDGSKGWKATLGKDVNDFINRFKIYRNKIKYNENRNVLRITFEDLILQYENSLNLIFEFLEETPSIHINKKKYFDPSVSKKGVGMWKDTKGNLQKDIGKIYIELKEYCLDI